MTYLHPNRAETDEVYQRYLDRAIADINELADEVRSSHRSPLGSGGQAVVGTGHPLASIFMLKLSPRQAESEEGVAFYGRAGEAILRSSRRLNIDPLDLYGTNCVKRHGAQTRDDGTVVIDDVSMMWIRRELEVVEPRMVVAMGAGVVEVLNDLAGPGAVRLTPVLGMQSWTPSTDVIVCPDIDQSLDGAPNKRSFWMSFRELGDWYESMPPY